MKKSTAAIRHALALVAAAGAARAAAKVAYNIAQTSPDTGSYAAYLAADRAACTAADAAAEALGALPWGLNGSYRVSDRAANWDGDRLRVLFRNRRPVAAAKWIKPSPGWTLHPVPEAPPRQKAGAAAHAAQKADAERVRAALRALPTAIKDAIAAAYWGQPHPAQETNGTVYLGAGWYYHPGQEGGRLVRAAAAGPEGDYGSHLLPRESWGAGRAVRGVIIPAARVRELAREARAAAARRADAAVAEARALRASFGDRCAL